MQVYGELDQVHGLAEKGRTKKVMARQNKGRGKGDRREEKRKGRLEEGGEGKDFN